MEREHLDRSIGNTWMEREYPDGEGTSGWRARNISMEIGREHLD